jgi:hypothetical protein
VRTQGTQRHPMADRQAPLECADLASGIGLLILGIGVGALFGGLLYPPALYFVAGGILLHGWGMFRKHGLKREFFGGSLWWVQGLYGLCWVLLAALILYLRSQASR